MRRKQIIESDEQREKRLLDARRRTANQAAEELSIDEMVRQNIKLHGP